MKHIILILLLCACPVVYGQSVKQANSNLELNMEKSVDIELADSDEVGLLYQADTELDLDDEVLATEESDEIELTNSEEAVTPFMFTMTSGAVQSVGRILLSSSGGTAQSVPIVVEPKQESDAEPISFALYQNYPNPFNPTTMLEFDLPKQSIVTLKLYNTLGQEVATLIQSELMDEGSQEVELDASGLPSSVYFYRIAVVGQVFYTDVKKMLLLR
ncbi:MAG: T9SS type A sorting domain-containing protein [Ignavibacteriae bacterium]|nr:T9SS type A sorting domain-containing protein [Ignavibacteriota bacterium]